MVGLWQSPHSRTHPKPSSTPSPSPTVPRKRNRLNHRMSYQGLPTVRVVGDGPPSPDLPTRPHRHSVSAAEKSHALQVTPTPAPPSPIHEDLPTIPSTSPIVFRDAEDAPSTNGTPTTNGVHSNNLHQHSSSTAGASTRTLSDTPSSPAQQHVTSAARSYGGLVSPALTSESTRSSQIISRLTSEVETLRRNLNAEQARNDESQRNLATARQVIESLRAETDNLAHMRETESKMLVRRDRKIGEVKDQLEHEVERRHKAEEAVQDLGRQLNETRQQSHKEVAEAKEARAHAEAQYAVISGSFDALRREVDKVRQQMEGARAEKDKDAEKLAMLETVHEMQATSIQRHDEVAKRMVLVTKDYSYASDAWHAKIEGLELLRQEMEETRDRMRWLMGLQGNRGEEPPELN